MNDNKPIGIFDSGVGGLSIFSEITKLLPYESIVYLGDQANVPYGSKTEEELRRFTEIGMNFLFKKKVKLIIIACNTATVYALTYLRSKFKLPIIGIVPVVKTAVQMSQNGRMGILSTVATSKSTHQKKLIKKFTKGRKVYNVGTNKLVSYVERGEIKGGRLNRTLDKLLKSFQEEKIDTIALGCSHFLFLRDEIAKNLRPGVIILDSGTAIARQAERVLKNNNALNSNQKPEYRFFTSGNPEKFKKVAEKLLGISNLHILHAEL